MTGHPPKTDRPSATLVVDASAIVEELIDGEVGEAVVRRLGSAWLHAPGHFDAEVLSALGRLSRAGRYSPEWVAGRLKQLRRAPIQRHSVRDLMEGAWARRDQVRLTDALYLELADKLDTVVVTTDARLGRAAPMAEVVAPD